MKIGIIGAGLIGGSLLLNLAEKNHSLYLVTRNPNTRKQAEMYTTATSDSLDILKECEVIFICTPMHKIIDTLDKLENIVPDSAIVTDVASLKSFVMEKKRPFKFIGSHPMAGTENSGFSSAFKELFQDAKWVLTPSENIKSKDLNILKELIEETGAKTILLDAQTHDKAAALISHMPMLLSQALMKCAMNNNSALQIAASGFRDMTRLSMSNTEMAKDMIDMNSTNIKHALEVLQVSISELLKDDYTNQIKEIQAFRKNMYDEQGKNKL